MIGCLGLHLILAVNQDEYVSGDVAGIRLVVTPQGEMPFPSEGGITLVPGQTTQLKLTTVQKKIYYDDFCQSHL